MTSNLSARLAALATPTLFEADPATVGALDPVIRPVFKGIRLTGPAFTVAAGPADNLAIHRALDVAAAGSVLVVTTGPDPGHGFFGEIMMEAALVRGIAGLVIDGGVRDTAAFRDKGFPVFAHGTAIRGTAKRVAGTLDQPVVMAGSTICPGDWMVGDDDGVVAVPAGRADEIIRLAEARVARETAMIKRIRAGEATLDLLNLRDLLEGARHGA